MLQADQSLQMRKDEQTAANFSIMISAAQTTIGQNIQMLQYVERGSMEFEELMEEIKTLKAKVRDYTMALENSSTKKRKESDVSDPFLTPVDMFKKKAAAVTDSFVYPLMKKGGLSCPQSMK